MVGVESTESLLQKAETLHKAGSLARAVPAYLDVLRAEPEHPQALGLLGVAFLQLNDLQQALALLGRAVARTPNDAEVHNNLGLALQRSGRHAEAIERFREALKLNPDLAAAHMNLGNSLRATGKARQAAASLKRAIALQPRLVEALASLGDVLIALGEREEAANCYRKALSLNPRNSRIPMALGNLLQALGRPLEALKHNEAAAQLEPNNPAAHLNLGSALQLLGQYDTAVWHYRRSLALDPGLALTHTNLGSALVELRQFADAINHFEQALVLQPTSEGAQLKYGYALLSMGRYEEAIARCERALTLNPGLSQARVNLGIALQTIGRFDDAVREFDRLIASGPEWKVARVDKALCYLTTGRFAEGWPLYEHRWSLGLKGGAPAYKHRKWEGEKLGGTLLVWAEQGLGDQILHAGMIAEARARVGELVYEVEPRLVPLFARSLPRVKVVARGPKLYAGRADAQIAAGSLGRHLRRSWGDFPQRDRGHLVADAEKTAALSARLHTDGRPVIGVSWISTNPKLKEVKSAPLHAFEPVLRLPDCRFVDLQYGNTAEERAAVEQKFGVRVEHLDDIDNTRDIDGLAALITACDAVVTVSNTTAHLAGALGKPTFVLLPRGNARLWYWFKEGDDSPWYPRVRVRRQQLGQSWAQLIASVVDEVASGVIATG